MESIKYPIGEFVPDMSPTTSQLNLWVDEISEMPKRLKLLIENLTSEQLNIPYRPGGWTIKQVVHHLADNNMNAYIRFKRALTEENPVVPSYREDLWAELVDYRILPIEDSFDLLELLHRRFATLIRGLHEDEFQRTFNSSFLGIMRLDTAIQRYAWHGRHHMAQIETLIKRGNKIGLS